MVFGSWFHKRRASSLCASDTFARERGFYTRISSLIPSPNGVKQQTFRFQNKSLPWNIQNLKNLA